MIKKYRRVAKEVEGMQYTYPAPQQLKEWLGDVFLGERKDRHWGAKGEMIIKTLEDGSLYQVDHVATEGDYIVKGVMGEFYAVKPDIFKEIYEEV